MFFCAERHMTLSNYLLNIKSKMQDLPPIYYPPSKTSRGAEHQEIRVLENLKVSHCYINQELWPFDSEISLVIDFLHFSIWHIVMPYGEVSISSVVIQTH